MRLMSFEHDGRSSFGIATGDGVIDAGAHLRGAYADLRAALGAGALRDIERLAGRSADHAYEAVRFLPVIADPAAKFICVGVNYLPHIREMGREPPDHPVTFVRFANSLVGHEEAMLRPVASEQYDYEGELAVVIGRTARHVRRSEALSHVAGFSCFNDGSLRDFQNHGPQWTPGKNFESSGAFGPWLVTTDEQPDPAALELTTRLNGQVVQHASVAELCFDVPRLIEYVTSWARLEPGDVIVTGTPGGVGAGRNPPLWMRDGDRIEVEISGIGVLRNSIVDEHAPAG